MMDQSYVSEAVLQKLQVLENAVLRKHIDEDDEDEDFEESFQNQNFFFLTMSLKQTLSKDAW
jgi:hypothetical protein